MAAHCSTVRSVHLRGRRPAAPGGPWRALPAGRGRSPDPGTPPRRQAQKRQPKRSPEPVRSTLSAIPAGAAGRRQWISPSVPDVPRPGCRRQCCNSWRIPSTGRAFLELEFGLTISPSRYRSDASWPATADYRSSQLAMYGCQFSFQSASPKSHENVSYLCNSILVCLIPRLLQRSSSPIFNEHSTQDDTVLFGEFGEPLPPGRLLGTYHLLFSRCLRAEILAPLLPA